MSTFNGPNYNLLFKCSGCKNESLEVDLSDQRHKEILWSWLQQHSSERGSYENVLVPRKYVLYICKNCKTQLYEGNMGKKCPKCNAWTYEMDCKQLIEMRP